MVYKKSKVIRGLSKKGEKQWKMKLKFMHLIP